MARRAVIGRVVVDGRFVEEVFMEVHAARQAKREDECRRSDKNSLHFRIRCEDTD